MTITDDDAFAEHLRERTVRSLPSSQLDLDLVLRNSQRKARSFRTAQVSAGLLAATLGVIGVASATGQGAGQGGQPLDVAGPRDVQNGTQGHGIEDSPSVTPTPAAPGLCAEFPMPETDGPDYEGWWNSTPADADGQVITDPTRWPLLMRDHPKTALVDTTTGRVISTWDRVSCGPLLDYGLPAGAAWPTDSVIVLDAMTGDVVDVVTVTPPVN